MNILFICKENTCRSQMAEGFAKNLGLKASSAGVSKGAGVNPRAVEVMAEIGIDISGQKSNSLDEVELERFNFIVSMCSVETNDFCPSTYIGTQENWNIDDPSGEDLSFYRQIRDQIREKVEISAD